MLTLCWSKLVSMMAAVDETNCFPSPNQNGLLLSSRRTFDLSSFENLFMYLSNYSLPQAVLVAPESNTEENHASDSRTCESKS